MSVENVYHEVVAEIKKSGLDHVVGKLKYRNKQKGIGRLKAMLESGCRKWFASGGYDFVYETNQALFLDLCSIFKRDCTEETVTDYLKKLHKQQYGVSPYLFADTQFVRTKESVFTLIYAEHLRRIQIPRSLSAEEDFGIAVVCDIARQHFDEHDGVLPVWGKIVRYLYVLSPNQSFEITPEGVYLASHDLPTNEAFLSI